MQDLLCILVLQQCHCHHRTLAHTYAWSRPCLGHNQSFCLQQLHHQFSEWHHSPTKSLFHRHNENSQLELPDRKFIYVTFHKTCISFKVQTLTSYSLDQSTPQNKVLKCCWLDRRPLVYTTTTITTVLWPLYRSTCIRADSTFSEELEDFVRAKFYCLHAFADGHQCIRIREKMLEFSSTVLSTLYPYLHRESKKQDTKLLPITFPNINWFSKFFTTRLTGEFVTNSYLNIPLHIKYVATLPCKIWMLEKWRQSEICIVINEKSQDSTAKYLSFDGLLHCKFITQFAGERISKIGQHLAKLQANGWSCHTVRSHCTFVLKDAELAR